MVQLVKEEQVEEDDEAVQKRVEDLPCLLL
jgi:hypothetical protein